MSIYVGTGRINYPARRGPCPYGFHVGTSTEWTNIKSAGTTLGAWTSSGGTNFSTYLKMPLSGYRNALNSNVTGQGTEGRYRCCSNYNTQYASYATYFNSSSLSVGGFGSCYGFNVRPIKDDPVVPTSSWTTIYQGTGSAGIFWNSSSGLISISKDGTTWYTIADKNLGATTVWNSGDTLSEANCGKYFQHGNNYPFPYTGTVTKSTTKVSTTGYGPGNRYYSSTFIYNTGNTWSSTPDGNLRGGVVGAVKADVKDICVGAGVNDFSLKQGPCPEGFHIPAYYSNDYRRNDGLSRIKTMFNNLGIDTSNGNACKTYLKMPFAGYRNASSGSTGAQGTTGRYRTHYSSGNYAYENNFSSSGWTAGGYYRGYGFPIRPSKDVPVIPDNTWTTLYNGSSVATGAGVFWNKGLGLISISDNGTKWITIADKNLGAKVVYNDGDTLSQDNCGYYYQWGNNYGFPRTGSITTSSTQVDVIGYGPGNYYSSSTFITQNDRRKSPNHNLWGGDTPQNSRKGNVKQVYVGTTPARPTYNPGIYWNKGKGLISISRDGKNWITIADKNLGAKVVYNDGDTLSQDNCGYYYQWGNNYGFAWTGSVTTTTTRVNTSSYSWQNPYYGSTFFKGSGSPYDWSSSPNYDLWGDTANTLVARQGPCPTGWHVPTHDEEINIISWGITLGAWTSSNATNIKKYIKCPFAGYRDRNGRVYDQGSAGHWLSSSQGGLSQTYHRWYTSFSSTTCGPNYSTTCDNGNSIRPFKNEPVVPDNSRAVLYQPS